MIHQLRTSILGKESYPPQFWLLFWTTLLFRASFAMMWPFTTIYVRQKLDISVSVATLLLSVQAVASLLSVMAVGSLMDQFGRKGAMILGVFAEAFVLIGMAFSTQFPVWVVLMAMHGALYPIFGVGVNTMVTDIVQPEQRASAYALNRMVSNAGIAIGPMIGGLLAQVSFQLIFLSIAVIFVVLAVIMQLSLEETVPRNTETTSTTNTKGYGTILKDRLFLQIFGAYIVILIAYTQVFVLLPLYTQENFGLRESQYTLLFTLNASMVVFLQYSVTRQTQQFRTATLLIAGAVLYMVGVTSITWDSTLPMFLLSMGIMTLGELVMLPTLMTLVGNLAPVNMRARYMGVFSLGYPVASGIGPVMGGLVNDHIAPTAIWTVAGLFAAVGVMGFLLLARRNLIPNIAPAG